jgi:hypothetical protein
MADPKPIYIPSLVDEVGDAYDAFRVSYNKFLHLPCNATALRMHAAVAAYHVAWNKYQNTKGNTNHG